MQHDSDEQKPRCNMLEQLKNVQEPDGSITLQDARTKEQVNYVLLPEEAQPCIIGHPWAYAAVLKKQTPFQSISGTKPPFT
eukprot:4005324-Amphidinium_carterae.1